MRRRSICRVLLVSAGVMFAVILAAQPVTSVPQSPSFGTADLTYVRVSGLEFFTADGNPYRTSTRTGRYPVVEQTMRAALHVPGGSVIDYLQIDFCDTTDPQDILLFLFDCDAYGKNCVQVANVNSFADTGCASISTGGFNHPVDNLGRSLVLEAIFQFVDNENLSLAGAVVGYRLQVSPPPSTATFNDVPTDHPFFQYIEALAASGITGGCNASPPLYCPDAPLTRGQMAVFLAKGLGLHFQ